MKSSKFDPFFIVSVNKDQLFLFGGSHGGFLVTHLAGKMCERQGLCEQYAGKVCTLLFRSSNAFFLESHLVKTGFCFARSDFERILPVRISGGVSAEYK